jgi:hypothetical protein
MSKLISLFKSIYLNLKNSRRTSILAVCYKTYQIDESDMIAGTDEAVIHWKLKQGDCCKII